MTQTTIAETVPKNRRRRRSARSLDEPFRERARDALRSEGHRMTQQRDILLNVIENAGAHLDADGLYQLARRQDNRISLSTVYRTLSLLKRHNLIDELHLSEEHHHYEAKTAEEHYHLVCIDCGAVEEFAGGIIEHVREVVKHERGFHVTSLQLDIAGMCARCQKEAA
ncbi:MAG: transcriptional repressor [Chloroflexi bacterium]|nr:transcriptional repressor [Chloroflexota bacterium]